jgi:hypothetical protein
MTDEIKKLENKLDIKLSEQQIKDSEDKVTKKNKWKPRQLDKLHKKSLKKPEYVLVQYLRNNNTMNFKLCKVISGNIVVIENKGHKLNPRMVWRHGKYFWYIIGEWDKEPISPRYLEKIRKLGRSTDNHPILMKMVLGAVQKKEELKAKKNIGWIIGIAVAGIILWLVFGAKLK